jgi:hypothetical protein
MSTGETHRNIAEIFTAAALDHVKPRAMLIAPWRIDANQDNLHKGLDECGCAFCPDDDGKDPT